MIMVRTEFECKWGRVQEVVDRFKAAAEQMNGQKVIKSSRIMTDLSGRFDTVIVESEVESIDAYFGLLHASFADPEFQAAQAALAESPYRSGQRNFYTIEGTYEAEA